MVAQAENLYMGEFVRHIRHFRGQKLRLGGDALGADPTYLLYLPSRPYGGI